MDHRLADTVWPDELDVVFAVLDNLLIEIQVHILVIECIDMTGTHRAVQIALRRAFQRDLDWSSGQHSLMAKVACRDAQPVSKFPAHFINGCALSRLHSLRSSHYGCALSRLHSLRSCYCFQPSAINPSVYARS